MTRPPRGLWAAFALIALTMTCEHPQAPVRTHPKDPLSSDFLPNAPTGLRVQPEPGAAILTWIDNSDFEDGYLIEKSLNDSDRFQEIARLPANSTTYRDTSGTIGTPTLYRVASYAVRDGAMRIQQITPVNLVLGGLAGFWADCADTPPGILTVTLSWYDNCFFESRFEIFVSESQVESFRLLAIAPANATSYVDTLPTVDFGQKLRYRLCALGPSDSTLVVIDSAHTDLDLARALRPSNVQATLIHETRTIVSWQDNALFEDGYHVVRTDGIQDLVVGSVGANSTSLEDTVVLTSGSFYRYAVFAYKGQTQTERAYSSWREYSIPPPSLHIATHPSSPELLLEHETTFAHSYIIERSNGDSLFRPIAIVPAGTLSYVDAQVDVSRIYDYRVKSLSSPYSDPRKAAYVQQYQPVSLMTATAEYVTSLSFSPNGRYLATGGSASWQVVAPLARIWDVSSGSLVRTLTGEVFSPSVVAYNGDGSLLATAALRVSIWDPQTGAIIRSLSDSCITDCAFNFDGDLFATVDWFGTVRLYSVPSWSLLRSLTRFTGGTAWQSVSFSRDGTSLVTQAEAGNIVCWNPSTGMVQWLIPWGDQAYVVRISPDSRTLAIAQEGGRMAVLDVNSKREIYANPSIRNFSYSSDGSKLALAGYSLQSQVIDASTCRPLGVIQSPGNCIAFSPTSDTVAIGSENKVTLYRPDGSSAWSLIVDFN